MKDRKHLTHIALVDEVTRQLTSRFHPNPLNIKKQIEGLIDVSGPSFFANCTIDRPSVARILDTL
jgi:hypothetical protein